jgi:hypothetical protein
MATAHSGVRASGRRQPIPRWLRFLTEPIYRNWSGGRDNKYGNLAKERTVSRPLLSVGSVFRRRADFAGGSTESFFDRQLFEHQSFLEVKMHKCGRNKQSAHSFWEKLGFSKRLGKVWQDLQDDPHWKYEQLSPVQLLEKSELHRYPTHNDELARANWFWSRRPRLLPVAGCIAWLTVALGLPFWLFIVPWIGVPLLIIAAAIVDTEIVQSVRWRRQYELSIDRLIRTSTNGRDTFDMDVFA